MIPIAASVPSVLTFLFIFKQNFQYEVLLQCLVLYWTTSSAFGLIQNLILLSPKVRRFFRIPKTANELQKPYTHIIGRIKNTLFIKQKHLQ